MGERSSSGVRNIRAMFEAKSETTSPPSRGRSPAGSEGAGSGTPRPLSKVRASFVAVERSGQLGPQIGLRKMSDAMDVGPDGAGSTEIRTASDQPLKGTLHANGSVAPSNNLPLTGLEEEDSTLGEGITDQKADDVGAVEQTTGTTDAAEDLGVVLKGSPFEPITSSGTVEPVLPLTKPSDTVNNGSSSAAEKETDKPKTNPVPNGKLPTHIKSRPNVQPAAGKPSAISTKSEPQANHKPGAAPLSGQSTKSTKHVTPKIPTMLSQQPGSKATSPVASQSKSASKKSAPVEEADKDNILKVEKQPIKKLSRTSLATQGPRVDSKTRQSAIGTSQATKSTATATKCKVSQTPNTTSTTSQAKPIAPSSPKSSKKPAPKSPTRPVPLPASATAPTAAFVAKAGIKAPSRSPSRASTGGTSIERKSSTLKKDRVSAVTRGTASTLPPGLQKKASRPSLPAASHAADRPKSRASTVPDDSFLARMMRPTASSANKAHEKVETKSPPRKAPAAKPTRKSEAPSDSKSKGVEDDPVPPLLTPIEAPKQSGQDEEASKGEQTGEAGGLSVGPNVA